MGDQLAIERKSIFGTKWIEMPVADVAEIAKRPSGMEINNVPVMQLMIRESGGKKHGLLSQLTDAELDWLADELNRAISDSA